VVSKKSIFLALTLTASVVIAHESPEHTILALDKHQKLTPPQLHQRALAHRATGKLDQAIADLQSAIAKEPKNLGYQLELTRMQLTARQPTKARHTADHALKLATTADQRANIHILRAEAYQLELKPKDALAATQLAFQAIPQGEIEWFLLRSECQRALGLHQQRIDNLAAGLKIHPSAVLKSHWIDALIDASQFAKALKEIDPELTDRRWKSSYLIKRARALIGLDRKADTETALLAALSEIAPRLNPKRPDPILLADQGIAYALLGQKAKAQHCLKLLHQHHAPDWITIRLEESISKK
jgi:tetratricopeptide (TPR) repeat protein